MFTLMVPQEARTIEELEMQRIERQRTVQFFKHLSSRASAIASDLQEQHTEMFDEAMQQIQAAQADRAAVVGSLQEELQQSTCLYAQQLLHEEWAQRFRAWSQQAEAAFRG